MKTKATLATAAFLLAATAQSRAAISVLISDDGTNLTMTATGSYTLANVSLTPFGSLNANAGVAPPAGQTYGWETGNSNGFNATFIGALAGTDFAIPATTASANIPFWVQSSGVRFSDTAPTTGTVNNTATFNGRTLASMGMVAGQSRTGTWGLGGPDEIITITTVPEPSALLLSALALPALLRRRRA